MKFGGQYEDRRYQNENSRRLIGETVERSRSGSGNQGKQLNLGEESRFNGAAKEIYIV